MLKYIKSIKGNTILSIILIIALGVLVYKQNSGIEEAYIEKSKAVSDEKIKQLQGYIENKKIESIYRIVKQNIMPKVIFIYSATDCSNCIKRGYEIIKTIDSTYKAQLTAVVKSDAIISNENLQYDYKKVIYNDGSQIIRKEMNYILTPVILIVDHNMIIKKVYNLTIYDSKKYDRNVIKHIKDTILENKTI